MADTNLLQFMRDCIVEVESRLGVVLTMKEGDVVETEILDPKRYTLACSTLHQYAPRDTSTKLFELEDAAEISPAHFVDLLCICLDKKKDGEKQTADCIACTASTHALTSMFFAILDGHDPKEVMPQARDGVARHVEALASAFADSIAALTPFVSWAELMFDPECVTHAARMVEGLTCEQGRAVLDTAFTVVNSLPKKPDPDRFKGILRNTRDLIIASNDK